MQCKITFIFDTSGWKKDSLNWLAGWQHGGYIICDETEVLSRMEQIIGLGHLAEIEYLKEE